MTKLEILINNLDTDKFCAVTITNKETNQVICRNKTSENILEEFGNAQNMFDGFLENGQTNLVVEPKRKNGNNFKPSGEVFTISPEIATVQEPVMQEPIKETFVDQVKKKKKKKKNKFGLSEGLSGAEFRELDYKARTADDLKELNRDLKTENASLKKENEQLLRDQLKKEFTKENNDSRNALMLQGLQSLPMLAGAFGLKMPQAGLSASENSDLSEVQTKILEVVKRTIEPVNAIFLKVLTRLEKREEGDTFETEFMELLTSNQII